MEHSFNASSFNLSADTLPPLQEHPFYKEGMVHIDAGRWREAFDSFQHLAELYPDVAEAQRLLDDIKMRATLSEVKPKSQSRAAAEQRVKRLVTGALVILIIAPILYVSYDLWLGPLISQEWRRRQVTEIRAQADQALIAGDYLQAQQLLEQLQVLLPEDPETAAALSQIQEVSQLTTLYGEAKAAMASNDWEHAATALTQLQVLDSEYRDVSDLLKIVEKARPLEAQFQVAETAFANGQWSAAIEQYQTLRQQDLTFRANDIQANLFESYLAHGRAIIDQTDTDPEAVTAAIVQFTEALKLSPVDATVLTERRLAEDYLLSLDASSIDERIALLQSIYEQQPDYANGTVTQRLYDNLVDRAGQSLATNNEDAAIADYQLAAQLPVEDATEAQQSLADLTD